LTTSERNILLGDYFCDSRGGLTSVSGKIHCYIVILLYCN